MSLNGEEILDFEGDESTSQGGGGLADDGAEPMAVGKLSKTAKKRAKKRLEKLAAARTEAERHAVLLETVTKTKRSAGERLQVRKRKIKKNLKLANDRIVMIIWLLLPLMQRAPTWLKPR